GDSVCSQKLGDAHVVPVFRALEIVFYQNERLLRHATNTIEPAIGTAFFNRRDLDLSLAESRQVKARLLKKQIGFHFKQWRHVRLLQQFDECGRYNFPARFEK